MRPASERSDSEQRAENREIGNLTVPALGHFPWRRFFDGFRGGLRLLVLLGMGVTLLMSQVARSQNAYPGRVAKLAEENRPAAGQEQAEDLIPLSVAAKTFPALRQPVSIDFEEDALEEALRQVATRADLPLSYSSETVEGAEPVTLEKKQVPAHEVFRDLLESTDLALMVSTSGHLVLTSRSEAERKRVQFEREAKTLQVAPVEIAKIKTDQIQHIVSGTVTDASSGETLPGVNIRVMGTTVGTATDREGEYELEVPAPTDTLRFSFVGYKSQTIPIGGRSTVDVAMQPTTLTGGEVVVTGYSAQQKLDLTGSVDVVDMESFQSMPESQITDQLQGMVSGVTVISSGQPGEDPQIRIRGINTFGNNTPLFVVDGLPTQSIDNLNSNDVESIQVLKDASAATIYGARAANGVVVIETKQGEGDMTVQFNSYAGISKQPDESNPWNLLDPQGRAELEWMAFRNSGQEPSDPQYGSGEDPRLPDFILPEGAMEGDPGTDPSTYFLNPFYTDPSQLSEFHQIVRANKGGTDWFDELFRTAAQTKTDLTVSGGSEQGSYLLGLGYLNEGATIRQSFLERYSIRVNTRYNVNDHIRIGENLSYTVEENKLILPPNTNLGGNSAIARTFRMRPIVPVRDIMGNWAGSKGAGLGSSTNQPVSGVERTRNDDTLDKRLFGSAFVEVSFLEDFRFRTMFGGSINSGFETDFQFPTYEDAQNTTTSSFSEGAWNHHDWTLTSTLNYQHTFGQNHNVTALAGGEIVKQNTRFETASVDEFFSFDPDFVNLSNGSGTKRVSSATTVTSLVSQFAKVDYNYRRKYFLSGTIRRDGSSKLLDDRYGIFPAVSAGWRISEEPFMDGVSWLTDLKIRAGWGVMGNQLNVTPNNAYTLFGSRQFAYDATGSNSETEQGFVRSQIGAPQAKWEKDKNLNIGVDIAVLEGQLEATIDYYRKDIEDLLFNPELPATAGGADPPFVNVASMLNTGVDVSLRGQTEVRGVQIQGNANLTTYSNEITSVAEGFDSFSEETRRFNAQSIVRNEVGHEMSSFYGFQVIGFWQSEEEVEQANAQAPDGLYQPDAAPGRFRYKDVNGDGQITAADRTFLGSPNPDLTYGLNLRFSYSNWDLGVSLYGSQGAQNWNHVKWWTDFFSSFNGAKSKEALENSWKPGADNSDATVPIQELERTFSTNQVPNSYFVEDASYLRVQNIQLGYSLPSEWIGRLGLEKLRIYAQASNVFTLTGYSNPEPEVGGENPTDVTSFAIDEGTFPTPREFLAGVNLTF